MLGQHDSPTQKYCWPRRTTNSLLSDAFEADCRYDSEWISARGAFAHSLSSPLLWRTLRVVKEEDLRATLRAFGINPPLVPSLRLTTVLGKLLVSPAELQRVAHAITIAMATSEHCESRTPDLEYGPILPVPNTKDERLSLLNADSYRQILTPHALQFAKSVLFAPLSIGTLHELSDFSPGHRGIELIWGKTGTVNEGTRTKAMWIVGGLVSRGRPYSWLIFATPKVVGTSFGRANANSLAPVARVLIEAAIRDSISSLQVLPLL